MSPIQPVWVPPNVDFLVDDCTNEWLATNIDLVHFRFMVMILRDVPSVMKHCYKRVTFTPCMPQGSNDVHVY